MKEALRTRSCELYCRPFRSSMALWLMSRNCKCASSSSPTMCSSWLLATRSFSRLVGRHRSTTASPTKCSTCTAGNEQASRRKVGGRGHRTQGIKRKIQRSECAESLQSVQHADLVLRQVQVVHIDRMHAGSPRLLQLLAGQPHPRTEARIGRKQGRPPRGPGRTPHTPINPSPRRVVEHGAAPRKPRTMVRSSTETRPDPRHETFIGVGRAQPG